MNLSLPLRSTYECRAKIQHYLVHIDIHCCIALCLYNALTPNNLLIYSKVRNDIPLAGAIRNICNEKP